MPAAPARRVVAVGTPALDDATGAGVGTKARTLNLSHLDLGLYVLTVF